MSEGLWIAIAVVAVLVVIAALVIGLVRYRRRRIRLSTQPKPGVIDRSGGYTASSGITFSQTPSAVETVEPADRIDTSGLPQSATMRPSRVTPSNAPSLMSISPKSSPNQRPLRRR